MSFNFHVVDPARTATRISYGPGPDGQLMTADDDVQGYNFVRFDSNGDTRADAWYGLYANDGRGPDGLWFTADDAPTGWWWVRSSAYGSTQGGPGPDSLWVSDDDTVTGWESFALGYDPSIHVLYSEPGLDGAWFTADDGISGYYKLEFNAYGAETKRVRYSTPGPNGVWFDGDDEVGPDYFGSYATNTYSGRSSKWGAWDRQVSFVDAGYDGAWFTPDDTAGACRTHEFADTTQYWTRETVALPGEDGTCFTADDVVVGYATATMTY